jgi:hypothetical protein
MAEAFPLQWPEGWPRTPAGRRRKSKFGSKLGISQVTMLKHELRLLGAKNVIVSSNVAVRNDGLPYAAEGRRRYDDPGAAVFFTLNGKPKSMARDPYYTPWENVRSLVLAIEAMRSLERHGGATMVERAFAGFAALAPPLKAKRSWWDVLEVNRSASRDVIGANFRRLLKDRHPDKGGSEQQVVELIEARDEALSEAP